MTEYVIADKVSKDTAELFPEDVPVAFDDHNILTEEGVVLRLEQRGE